MPIHRSLNDIDTLGGTMEINDRLYVEIHPLERGLIPRPHPVDDAHFDPALIYKVLGMYNPSETSECYMVLANPAREIWFVPQRHLRAYGLIDSDELFMPPPKPLTNGHSHANGQVNGQVNGHDGRNGKTGLATPAVASRLPLNGTPDRSTSTLDGRGQQTPKGPTRRGVASKKVDRHRGV